MKAIIISIWLACFSCCVIGQDLDFVPPASDKVSSKLRIDANLYQLGKYAQKASSSEIEMKIDELALLADSLGRVNIEISFGEDEDRIDKNWLKSIGVYVDGIWHNQASLWVPPTQLIELAGKLQPEYRMTSVFISEAYEDNQGPGLMGSDSYNTPGTSGSGVRVAIIDGGFDGLTESRNASVAPENLAFVRTFVGGGLQGGSYHGTACLETVFDHAPAATYELYRISNTTHLGMAVDFCIDHGVDVISHSRSSYNTGWNDNSGPACAAANLAASNGILFFTSAGNRARQHWQGRFSDNDDDNWHNYSGEDEVANITVAAGERIWVRLQWANPTADYDLYLINTSGQTIINSTSSTNFESLSWRNNSNSNASIGIAVRHEGGGTPAFEIFCDPGSLTSPLQYAMSTGSTTSPSNSTHANVISVGAVHRNNYNSASGTSGIITNYSSQGPTNSGNRAPDIVGPTSTRTRQWGGFRGTSCSTPNVAGMAAAFWSSQDNYNARGVREVLFRKASLYKNWGSSGADNIYGHGGGMLYEYTPRTIYIYRNSNNVSGLNSRPYYNMHQADSHFPSGGQAVFLGGTYPQPPAGRLLNRPRLYISLIQDTRVE